MNGLYLLIWAIIFIFFPSQSPNLINACTALAIFNAIMIVEPSVNFYSQQYLWLY